MSESQDILGLRPLGYPRLLNGDVRAGVFQGYYSG